jgi:hypothetical protein
MKRSLIAVALLANAMWTSIEFFIAWYNGYFHGTFYICKEINAVGEAFLETWILAPILVIAGTWLLKKISDEEHEKDIEKMMKDYYAERDNKSN